MKIDKTAFKEVTEIDTLIYYHVSIPTPKITKAMLDKGLVQFYIKDSTNYMKGVVNLFTGSSYIRVGVTNHRFLPAYQEGFIGMGNNSFVIHLPTFGLRPDSMVMVTSWFGSSQVYDPYSIVKPQPPLSDIITYSELPPPYAILYTLYYYTGRYSGWAPVCGGRSKLCGGEGSLSFA